MCSVKTPKPPPQSTQASSQKPPVYMRNAYLDGLGINAENAGRNSLRIDLGGSAPSPTSHAVSSVPFAPLSAPGLGLGVPSGGLRGGMRSGSMGLGIRLL